MLRDENSKVFVIGPDFFGYCEAIRNELISMGNHATWHDERLSGGFWNKVIIRLQLKFLIYWKVKKHIAALKAEVSNFSSTKVLIFNPEMLSKRDIKDIEKLVDGNVLIYLWDSVENKKNFISIIKAFKEKLVTFDPSDARLYGIKHEPLFFTRDYNISVKQTSEPIISSVCTIHSHRALGLAAILKAAKSVNIKCDFHLYYSSLPQLVLKAIRHPSAIFSLRKFISNKKLSHQVVSEKLASASLLVDIAHPGQAGLTSRTFESLALGSNLITNNKWISHYPDLNQFTSIFDPFNTTKLPSNLLVAVNTKSLEQKQKQVLVMQQHRIDSWLNRLLGLLK
jgi:hypothetical protein